MLLKPGVGPEEALRDPGVLTRFNGRQAVGYEAVMYLAAPVGGVPPWFSFVRDIVEGDIADQRGLRTSAILFVRVSDRWMAVSFGFGRFLLRQDSFEVDFGLRTTLNAVDPARLRSVELSAFEELVVRTRRQASRSTAPATFGIDTARDILKAVTGEPRNERFGRRITGSDALALSPPIRAEQVHDLLAEILETYNSTAYRESFEWIDHVRVVRDHELLAQLDGELEQAVGDAAGQDLGAEMPYLAAPETLPDDRISGYRYFGERADMDPHPDLSLEDYLAALGDAGAPDIAALRRNEVRAISADTNAPYRTWRVYDCLVFELTRDDGLFLLADGTWYLIDTGFAGDIQARVEAIPRCARRLAAATPGEVEVDYNARVALLDPELVLLDRFMVHIPGERAPIEVCDLISNANEFIHVKRKTQSATLSHLFSQGLVAAVSFRQERAVRDAVRERLRDLGSPIAASIPNDRVGFQEFEVVYAVITRNSALLPGSLPFFSKLNLVRTADELRRTHDFRVSVLPVEQL
ncbi:MAG: DUF6119 family protein [Acidimicrobiia bacterium]